MHIFCTTLNEDGRSQQGGCEASLSFQQHGDNKATSHLRTAFGCHWQHPLQPDQGGHLSGGGSSSVPRLRPKQAKVSQVGTPRFITVKEYLNPCNPAGCRRIRDPR